MGVGGTDARAEAPDGGAARPVAPVLAEVLGSAARRLRARLAARAGRDTPVFVEPAFAATLAALLDHVAGADALWCVFPTPHGPPALVLLEEALLVRLVGPLFGGDAGDRGPRRGASEVERAVGARLARELVAAVDDAWTAGPPPRFSPGPVAPSPRVVEALDRAAPYLVARLEIGAEPHGSLLVAIPAAVVPGALPRTAAPPAPDRPARAPRYERLLPVELEVVVELARLQVPVRRLHGLSVGDEIPLAALGPATARVAGRPALTGEAGSRGGARSLRVLERVDSSSSSAGGDRTEARRESP